MIDPTPNEIAAMQAGGQLAGEYLESIGKSDLVTLTTEEWSTLIEVVVTGYCDTLRDLAGSDRDRLDGHAAEGAVRMAAQSFMAQLRARPGRERLSRHPDHAGHEEARALPERRLGRLSRTGPGMPSAPTTEHELAHLVGLAGRRHRRRLRPGRGARHRHRPSRSWRSPSRRSRAQRLGDTPALRIGRAPKRLLVYRAAEPFRGIRRAPLELLGLGQQFVAHAIHPDTGRPYDWPEETLGRHRHGRPAGDRRGGGARLPRRGAGARAGRAAAAVARDDRRGGTRRPLAHALSGTPEAVRAALAWIPNADLDYDSWVRIGLALKGALGDAGRDLFAAWSAQSGKDEPAFTAKTWDGLRPERIGAGTIYHLAIERGWKPDAALVLDGAAPRDPVHPAAGLLASIVTRPEPEPERGRRGARPRAHAGAAGALARPARRRARR